MRLCKRILVLTAALLCIFGALGLETFGEETGTAAETETAAEGETSAEPQEELTGIKKFFNGFLSLYENGGIVTEVLGSTETQVVDGRVLTVKTPPTVLYYLTYLLMAVFAYVLGSINFGVLVSTKMCNEDVRRHGSGNAGMTNVLRVYGKKPALLTFLGDYGKGLLSAFIGMLLGGCGCGYFALAFCMIGHAFPVFFKFKGGKCVATLFGGMTALEPAPSVDPVRIFLHYCLGNQICILGLGYRSGVASADGGGCLEGVALACAGSGLFHRDYLLGVLRLFYRLAPQGKYEAALQRRGTKDQPFRKEKERVSRVFLHCSYKKGL